MKRTLSLLLVVWSLTMTAQNRITVPFENGFVGNNTGSNSADSCYYTKGVAGIGLGFSNVQFAQNSTSNIFVAQGNDIIGEVLITDFNGVEHSIPGFIKWRSPSGSVTTMIFQPGNTTGIILATNGTNGQSSYTIDNLNYIGLTFNGDSLVINGVPGVVTGNAATNGLLDALNSYLGQLPYLSIHDTVTYESSDSVLIPISLSASSTSDVSVSFTIVDKSATQGLDYLSHTLPLTNSITFYSTDSTVLTKYIHVPIVLDTLTEVFEEFEVILNSPINASIAKDTGIITIYDAKYLATNDTAEGKKGDTVVINVALNDTMLGNSLDLTSLSIYTYPSNGSIIVDTITGQITYIPDSNFVGKFQFSYSICDTNSPALCDTAIVFVSVKPSTSEISTQIVSDSSYSICLDSITNLQGGVNSSSICGSGNNGTLTSTGGHCYSYTPDSLFVGVDTICLIACNNDFCDTNFVLINVVDDCSNDSIPPTISTQDLTVYLDSFGLASYDTSMLLKSFYTIPNSSYAVDTLAHSGPITAMSIAYNPIKKVYYALQAGARTVNIYSYQEDGTLIATSTVSFDPRGLWWNKNNNQLEGNVVDDVFGVPYGLIQYDLDPSTGAALSSQSRFSQANAIPYLQCPGVYDYINNNILYFWDDSISIYDRSNDQLLSRIEVTGLPSAVNDRAIMYTGIAGAEAALYSSSSNQLFFINLSTGAFVSSSNLPSSAPRNSGWGISSIDGTFYLYDNLNRRWLGYFIHDSSSGSPLLIDNCGIDSVWQDSYDTTCAAAGETIALTTYAQDLNGNRTSSVSQVTVLDTIIPNIETVQQTTIYYSASGTASFDTSDIVTSTWDNCTIDSVWLSDTAVSFSIDSLLVKAYIVDESGNIDSSTSIVYLQDTIKPTILLNDTTLYLDNAGNLTFDTSATVDSIYDNLGIDTVWMSVYSGSCGTDTMFVTTYAMDINGNIDSAVSQILVLDTIKPTINCVDTTVYLDSNGMVTIDTSFIQNGYADNCGVDEIWINAKTYSQHNIQATGDIRVLKFGGSGSRDDVVSQNFVINREASYEKLEFEISRLGPQRSTNDVRVRIYRGFNSRSNLVFTNDIRIDSSGTQTIDLNSLLLEQGNYSLVFNPLAGTESDFYISTVSYSNQIIENFGMYRNTTLTQRYGNGSVNFSLLSVASDFTCSNSNEQVTVYVRDNSGNVDSCIANVTVLDRISPNLVAQNKTVYLDGTGSVSFDTSNMIVSTYDNCTVDSISMDITSATCSDDSVNVSLTITDVNGNSSTTMATVYVLDTISPNVLLANDTLYIDGTGNASNGLSDINNGSNDNCGITSITLSDSVYTCSEVGLNTVTVTVTDHSGNVSTETATVLVLDSVNPIAMCKNVTLYLDATGSATMSAGDIDNGSTDNCVNVTLSASQTSFTCVDLGQNNVTLTVTDGYGNVDSCTATVMVVDNTAPVANCQPATIYLNGSGVATLAASDIDNGSTDNCSVSLSVSQTTFNCSDLGANTVTLTVRDAQGLTSACTTTVTVLDTLAPVMVCQSVTVNLDASGNATITTSDVNNGSMDNCGMTLSLSNTTFDCTHIGSNTVTLLGTDASGNVDSCIATVIVVDQTAPVANCKPATIYLDTNGEARLLASDIDNASSDNCSFTLSITDTLFTCSDIGPNNVTLTATDSEGNSSICVAVVTVVDTLAPVASCKPATLYLDGSGVATLTASMIDGGNSSSCGLTVSVSQSSFTCSDLGVTTSTLSVTDASGNTSSCTASVTVLDTLAPMMSCTPATIYLDAMGMASLSVSQVDGGSTDNCGIATMSLSRTNFSCADLGTRTVTLTGVDASGNTSTCTTTVTVLDTLAPVMSCKSATVVLDATGTGSITTLDVDNGSADNCGMTMTLSLSSFDCTNIGTNSVTLIGTDASGNISTCTATVTVIDNMAPTAICQNITISLDANGQATIVASDVDGGSFDNCSVSSLNLDKTEFDCSNVGNNQVTLTVTDLYGNTSSCVATVTVEDNVAPVVYCPSDKNRTIKNTTCTYVVEDFLWETSNTDNCTGNGTTTEQFPVAGTEVVSENGRVTITIVTTDASMNSDSCTFDVIVTCDKQLDVPQFISPNGDGRNDFWDLSELSEYENNVVKIFNRYGTLVFEQRGYSNQFVGRGNVENISQDLLGNGMLPDGTYFYIIDLGTNVNDKKVYNGYLQIKK